MAEGGTVDDMKAPRRRRPQRRVRDRSYAPGTFAELANAATYVGCAEHKTYPSEAGPPRWRGSTASKCDPHLHTDFATLTEWVREAIRSGQIGGPELGYPKYIWIERDGVWYEGRQVTPGRGDYKGYAVGADESPPPGF